MIKLMFNDKIIDAYYLKSVYNQLKYVNFTLLPEIYCLDFIFVIIQLIKYKIVFLKGN